MIGPVRLMLDNFYAEARVRCGAVLVLQEDAQSPPERLLQRIWQHQRLLRDQLKTLDGQPLRILHPGFHNVESGPDFRGAVVQFGDEPARSGDVELDLRANGWHAHGHDRNPAFANVILHVVWDADPPAGPSSGRPVLLLRQVLDAPLGELSLWLGGEASSGLPEQWRGRCCAPLGGLKPAEQLELLHQAAQVRLRSKAAQFQARARQEGWEQALWEGLFRGLGYKHNVWPMQRLAELRPRWGLIAGEEAGRLGRDRVSGRGGGGGEGGNPGRAQVMQARLLGLSGLLPVELKGGQAGTDRYVRGLWDSWWRERDGFAEAILPRGLWHLHGMRPANHPQRRLALASGWAAGGCVASRLEGWCAQEGPERAVGQKLHELLELAPDEFWSYHWTLSSRRLRKAQPLLGASRVTDLAVNVVLPWLWARALEGKAGGVQEGLEGRFMRWRAAQDNSVLRLARERLLGGAGLQSLPGAAAQQGLMQIVRDFCEHSNAVCDNCKLPALVKEMFAGKGKRD
ncbi:MAG TPA: DUF2851 family protein [Verrucomicrobiae bacterium]|nr:DUF2851 family protein [Verrucomicrobiae bacterium]